MKAERKKTEKTRKKIRALSNNKRSEGETRERACGRASNHKRAAHRIAEESRTSISTSQHCAHSGPQSGTVGNLNVHYNTMRASSVLKDKKSPKPFRTVRAPMKTNIGGRLSIRITVGDRQSRPQHRHTLWQYNVGKTGGLYRKREIEREKGQSPEIRGGE